MSDGSVVCITGARGFIGKHLVELMGREPCWRVVPIGREEFADRARLRETLRGADAVVHLAALNRADEGVLKDTNISLVSQLIGALDELGARPHIVFSSSTQIKLDNPYGESKRAGMDILSKWSRATGAPVSLLEIPNVYGQGCRPFYNSVVATFCHLLAQGKTPEIQVDKQMDLIYVNELCALIRSLLLSPPKGLSEQMVPGTAVSDVSGILRRLKDIRDHYFDLKIVPDLEDSFNFNLYRMFITYLEPAQLMQVPKTNSDERGELFELLKYRSGQGQVFYSTTRPGVTRGNHYHTRKMEKFIVVSGRATVNFRRIYSDEPFSVVVDKAPAVVEIPIYCTHNIVNTGDDDLLTVFWTNEIFDQKDADTFFLKV